MRFSGRRLAGASTRKGTVHDRGPQGKISVDELRALVASGEIDTVVTAVCDMQGRLVGKRVTGQFFVEHCLDHGTHLCTYLLGTDMEMNTPTGFPRMNWETGYGDYLNRPDWATLRVIPWLEKTALVLGDLVDEDSQSSSRSRPARSCAARSSAPSGWAFAP